MPAPRVVVVTRETEIHNMRLSYGTTSNSAYYVSSRSVIGGQSYAAAESASAMVDKATTVVQKAIPDDWRQVHVLRTQLDRFVFEPNDFIVTVGQDGLVANVAKYLDGQQVIGFNDNSSRNLGVLAQFDPYHADEYLPLMVAGLLKIEPRTMVSATLDDGQELVGLNEIFIGHASHQSARYRIGKQSYIKAGQMFERQSSSGIIVSTGTGATGWASSIARSYKEDLKTLPRPTEDRLFFFVREPWASPGTQVSFITGVLGDDPLMISSEIEDRGTVFGDGMESDHFAFNYGRVVNVGIAKRKLNLIVAK